MLSAEPDHEGVSMAVSVIGDIVESQDDDASAVHTDKSHHNDRPYRRQHS
jgi:hypothetical protein